MEQLQCRIEVPSGSCLDLDDVQFRDGVIYTFLSPGRAGLFLRGTIHRVGPDEPVIFYLGERVPVSGLDGVKKPALRLVERDEARLHQLGWSSASSAPTSARRWVGRWVAAVIAAVLVMFAASDGNRDDTAFATRAISDEEYWQVRREGDLSSLARLWHVSPARLRDPESLYEVFLTRPRSERKEILSTLGRLMSRRIVEAPAVAPFFEAVLRSRDIEPAALREALIHFKPCVAEERGRAFVLLPLLHHWYSPVRQEAAIALGSLRVQAALPLLFDRLSLESDPEVLRDVIYGIGMYSNPQHAPHLEPFADHPNAGVRKAVSAARRLHSEAAGDGVPREETTSSPLEGEVSDSRPDSDRSREMR